MRPQQQGQDPASVAFQTVEHAQREGIEIVLIDTAGRLQTKSGLMDELAKIRRVHREADEPIAEVLLVLDATTGQNGLAQAEAFIEHAGVTGLVLTKLDGSAKGGFVLAVQEKTGIPIKLVGQGEGIGDLTGFTPHVFAQAAGRLALVWRHERHRRLRQPLPRCALIALLLAVLGGAGMTWNFVNGISAALDAGGNGAGLFVVLFIISAVLVLAALVISIVCLVRGKARGVAAVALVVSLLPIIAVIALRVVRSPSRRRPSR